MKKHLLVFILLIAGAIASAQSSGYFTEGFEEDSFPPEGWSIINFNSFNGWQQSIYDPVIHEGAKSAVSYISVPEGIDYLITKQFTVAAGDSITFWFRQWDVRASDTLYVQVSTTNSNPRRFTETIGTFFNGDGYTDARIWKRIALSLEAFAGKDVYIAFKHVNINMIHLDDVALGTPPAADIRVISMDVPERLDAGETFTPHAIFQNIGSQTQTFNVTLTAGAYSSTKTVSALAPLGYQQITFDNLSLQASVFEVAAYSSLAGDADTKNDTIRKQTTVYKKFESNGWVIRPDVPTDFSSDAVTLYTAGTAPNDTGYIFSISSFDNIRFNLRSNEWQKMTRNPYPNYYGSAFTYKGKIYYLGGHFTRDHVEGEPIYFGDVSIYHIATDTWTTGTPWFGFTNYAGCQYKDSLIYVIGGEGYGDHDETEFDFAGVKTYNAATDTWSYADGFPGIPSHGLRAGIVNNTIVVVGGYSDDNGEQLSQAYRGDINPTNPKEITWTRIANYPGGATSYLGATGVVSAEGPLVYFTAGLDSMSHPSKGTWAYNVDANRWLLGPDRPTSTSYLNGLAPFVLNDTVYIASVGGTDSTHSMSANEWLVLGAVTDVLPVHIISFTTVLQNNTTLLNWKVSEDGTGGYYIIQRAADAVHFANMSAKTDAGLASATVNYTGYDLLPLKGYNYYRLKIINADGSVSYSEVRAVNNTAANAPVYAFNIYPNPTRGLLNILLQNNSGKDAVICITVSDAAGRKIINENKTAGISLSVTYKLQPGVYVINLLMQDRNWKQSRKVVVE